MVEISEDSVLFRFSRSGGPGGQNVNKVSSRVTVLFDVEGYGGFSDGQKRRILRVLRTRADKEGRVRVASQKYRTQRANRRAAMGRLNELVTEALKTRKRRKKTGVPKWAKEKRLEEKKKRSDLKEQRRRKLIIDD